MGLSKHTASLLDSDRKGLNILIINTDEKRSIEFEAKTELDPYLQRVNVFFVSNIREARSLVKSKHIEIAIFPESLETMDFVSIQGELKNANDNIKMVPLVLNPSLSQYRESKQIGGVLDFEEPDALLTYESIRDLIVHVTRAFSKTFTFENRFKQLSILQRALLIKDEAREQVKVMSGQACTDFLQHFDFNTEETTNIVLAEMVYLPELTIRDYEHLLKDEENFEILEILKQTASPKNQNSKPSSSNGFVIVAANEFATRVIKGQPLGEILFYFKTRPSHLFHPSLRVLSEEVLRLTYQLLLSSNSARRLG